jgi:poly(3-hydroxyoctanoate) depolymerase
VLRRRQGLCPQARDSQARETAGWEQPCRLASLRPNEGTRWAQPDPLGLLWQIAAISTWSSIGDLGRIEAPTLIVCGAGDKAVPPANSRIVAARIPDARLVTIRAGHDLQKPGPAAVVAQLVEQFLDVRTPMAS